MIKHLRIKLALWFFFLVMTAYLLASVASFWSMNNSLVASIENDLIYMCEEIIPAVDYVNGKPTLFNWMRMATIRHIPAQTIIQLFDPQRNLVESYGPKGVEHLKLGKTAFCSGSEKITVYSYYMNLPDGCYVQVQLPSVTYDQTISSFVINECLRGVPLSILLAIFGWIYSGRAVAPIAKSLNTLRKFVDDAGHELNTPIALIENSIETIEADLRDHNLPTNVLKIIGRASNTLKGLSQNLLLLAKMEQPALALRLAPVNLVELLTDLGQDFSEAARLEGIKLRVQCLSDAVVFADCAVLVEVFNNLIANALHYTPPGGEIHIYSFLSEGNICVAVRDTGCGISQEYLPYIFDRFYRVDRARSRKEGGSGLGLSIVKAIVEAHKGVVRVDSEIGKGSTFFVSLPLMVSKQIKLLDEKDSMAKTAKLKVTA